MLRGAELVAALLHLPILGLILGQSLPVYRPNHSGWQVGPG